MVENQVIDRSPTYQKVFEVYSEARADSENIVDLSHNIECLLDPSLRAEIAGMLVRESSDQLSQGKAFSKVIMNFKSQLNNDPAVYQISRAIDSIELALNSTLESFLSNPKYGETISPTVVRYMLNESAHKKSLYIGKWAAISTLATHYHGREEKEAWDINALDMFFAGFLYNAALFARYKESLDISEDEASKPLLREEIKVNTDRGLSLLSKFGIVLPEVVRTAISDQVNPTSYGGAIVGAARSFDDNLEGRKTDFGEIFRFSSHSMFENETPMDSTLLHPLIQLCTLVNIPLK